MRTKTIVTSTTLLATRRRWKDTTVTSYWYCFLPGTLFVEAKGEVAVYFYAVVLYF
jgi:hypothetical protein